MNLTIKPHGQFHAVMHSPSLGGAQEKAGRIQTPDTWLESMSVKAACSAVLVYPHLSAQVFLFPK